MNDITRNWIRELHGLRIAFAAATLASLVACGGETDAPRSDHPMAGAAVSDSAPRPDDRVFTTIQDFVEGYWVRPVPPQGDPPASWSHLEASLLPEDCSACHPAQYEDWRTTVHSGAYSPGLSGQLVNWEQSAFGTVQSCLVCHAPLSEQSARLPERGGMGAESRVRHRLARSRDRVRGVPRARKPKARATAKRRVRANRRPTTLHTAESHGPGSSKIRASALGATSSDPAALRRTESRSRTPTWSGNAVGTRPRRWHVRRATCPTGSTCGGAFTILKWCGPESRSNG